MSVGPYSRRFSFRELYRFCELQHSGNDPFTFTMMASMMRVHPGNVGKSVQNDRMMSVWQADRCAINAGFHPSEIWDDWWDIEKDREKPRATRLA